MSEHFITKQLDEMAALGLRRVLRRVEGCQGARIVLDGCEVLNFCSNDYLGLASDERLKIAAARCMETHGFGSGASRLVCGNQSAHQQLEQRIASFKNTEAALVFSSGYMANVGIISGLFNRHDVIFADKINHASIIDGIKLSGSRLKRYAHNDMDALETLLKTNKSGKKRVIITDSVFSMDGDIAPLDKIVVLAKEHHCLVMIDEAHALGVMGQGGRGLAEHFGVESEIDIVMGTFSKAAGSLGAYCCGSKKLIEFLINKARSFIYTTGLPACVMAASTRAIDIIESEPYLRSQLWELTRFLHDGLRAAGFNIGLTQTPITPVMIGDGDLARVFSRRLLAEGIFISAILPPTVPVNTARLRLTLSAQHTLEDIRYLLEKMKAIGEELCLI